MYQTREKKRYAQSWTDIVDGKTLIGLYQEDVGRITGRVLTRKEEAELGKQIDEGREEAYNEFVARNVRLVMHIARRYITPGLKAGLEYADLIQEGNIGLLTALRKWDWRRGYKFSTYATWWIHQRIARAISDGGIIRIPVHLRFTYS